MTNRRLVPMPTRKAPAPTPAPRVVAQAAPLPAMKNWHAFAFLIVTAIAYYYLKWPILIIAAIDGFVNGWIWLSYRFPKTMWFVSAFLSGFLRGMMGGRRRR
jgi:hypothetical protein